MKTSLILLSVILLSLATKAQTVRDFSLEDLDGEWQNFEDIQGEQLTLIDFWASWCKPCMKAMPEIEKIHKHFEGKGLNVIGINTDGPRSISKVPPLTKALKVSYPVLSDINNELMQDLNISALPTLLLINKEGEIVYRHEGWALGDEAELNEQILKYLK